ncbi:MAG: glycerophosphodiester phosphodiesterase family protein [Bacilli bacterium]|nr:glycerophosphodiester phosphodiesterase family protein [Bacilli bacterium]
MKSRNVEFIDKYPIAHRGFFNNASESPENSLNAFKKAVENKYAIELDLQLSKDLQVVVFHDDDLKRVCNIAKNVRDFNYDELRMIKLMKSNQSMPLFKDVLELVNGKVPLIIELKSIKGMNNDLLPKVYELIKNYKGDYAIQSFDPTLVSYYRKNYPQIIRGQLVYDYKDSKVQKILKFLLSHLYLNFLSKPDFINSHLEYFPSKLIKFKKNGGKVICYTAKNSSQYIKAFDFFDNVIFEGFIPDYFYKK